VVKLWEVTEGGADEDGGAVVDRGVEVEVGVEVVDGVIDEVARGKPISRVRMKEDNTYSK